MASVTLSDKQWRALKGQTSNGAPAGGSVVIDVTAGDLTVTHCALPAGAGTTQRSVKFGDGGNQK